MNGHDETNWRGYSAAPDASSPESSSQLEMPTPVADERASHVVASHDELWRVQLGSGEVRLMTLDALDRAFNEGTIGGRALVLAPGSTEWTTLAAAARLDDEVTKPELTPSLSPVAIATKSAPPSIAPPREDLPSTPPDLELPDDEAIRPRRRGLLLAGIASAALTATAVAVVVANVGRSAPVDVKVNGAIEAPAPSAAEPLPPPRPQEPVGEKPQLTLEQKKELLDADKAREQKVRAKSQERSDKIQKTQKRARPSNVAPGLLNGGDPHDPLNGKL